MRRLMGRGLVLALCLSVSGLATQPVARAASPVERSAARLERESYESEDGGARQFFAYFPEGYDSWPDRRWPVLLFLHGDGELYHATPEPPLTLPVAQWIVRSERQTLCKLSPRYLLFTIDIVCEPLADMGGFEPARRDLLASLERMAGVTARVRAK